MKYRMTIVMILIQYFAIAQYQIDFPIDVKFDPLNSKLSLLKIKKVEQISKYNFYNDSTFLLDTNKSKFLLDYVFTYDSIFQLVSLKYDFRPEIDLNIPSDNSPVQIKIQNADSRLYKFSTGKDTVYYNYYEKEYIYNKGSLELVKIHKPLRWIIDGVYSKEYLPSSEYTENTIKDGVIIKKEIFRDGKLFLTIEYFYMSFNLDGHEIKLIERIIEKSQNQVEKETRINYFR
jgi:hypothetical protein